MTPELRVAATPGGGLVYRDGTTILVAGGDQPPDAALVEQLIAALQGAAERDGVRRLARILLDHEKPPAVGVVTIVGDNASVFLYGDLDLVSDSGRVGAGDSVLGLSETVPIGAGVSIIASGLDVPELPSWASLGSGAVAGSGVVVTRDGAESGATAAEPDDAIVQPEVSGHADIEPADTPPSFEIFSLDTSDEPVGDPLPIESPDAATDDADSPAEEGLPKYTRPVEVLGVLSPRGHFNHPEARYCSRTGVKMGASHTKVLTKGPRPPLGVITFDDGSTYTVQWNTIIGRDPFTDEAVVSQDAAPLVVVDDTQSVSRRHVMLEVVEWDVLVSDLGSQNGTSIRNGPNDEERLLGHSEKVVMGTGTAVRFGNRSFVYNEHHVR